MPLFVVRTTSIITSFSLLQQNNLGAGSSLPVLQNRFPKRLFNSNPKNVGIKQNAWRKYGLHEAGVVTADNVAHAADKKQAT